MIMLSLEPQVLRLFSFLYQNFVKPNASPLDLFFLRLAVETLFGLSADVEVHLESLLLLNEIELFADVKICGQRTNHVSTLKAENLKNLHKPFEVSVMKERLAQFQVPKVSGTT